MENRLALMETMLGVIATSQQPQAQSLVSEMSIDPVAANVFRSVVSRAQDGQPEAIESGQTADGARSPVVRQSRGERESMALGNGNIHDTRDFSLSDFAGADSWMRTRRSQPYEGYEAMEEAQAQYTADRVVIKVRLVSISNQIHTHQALGR